MTDQELKDMAWAIATGTTTFAADVQLKGVLTEVESDRLVWSMAPSPPGIRAFNGVSPSYTILIVQSNIVGKGITHMATAVPKEGAFHLINLPPAMADYIFHLVQAKHN